MSQRAIADTLGVALSTVSGYVRGGVCAACGGPLVTGAVSASSDCTHFGTWTAALTTAGVPLRRHHSWTRGQLLAAIRQWAAEHGGDPPGYADLRAARDHSRWPDPKTVATAFGGWRAAQNAAGFGGATNQEGDGR